jgi:hypothetical protein
MSKFKYTVEDTKECIIETEQQLRDLISTVLTAKYGLKWDMTPNGWSDRTRRDLEQRLQDEQKRFPHQQLSDRLLDYCDILHLKNMIEKNWQHFNNIFASKNNTIVMFDMLNRLRNPLMHGRPGIPLHQKYLCLGICGEFLQAIENWRQGYIYTVKTYECNLKFSVYIENDDEETAQSLAKEMAQSWLESVVDKLSAKLEDKLSDKFVKKWLLRISKGHIKISMTWKYRGYDGRYFRSADIKLHTNNYIALDQILAVSDHPFWVLKWTLSDDLDVSIVASKAKEMTGYTPSSSVRVQIGSGIPVLTNADFKIGSFNDARIRVSIDRGQQDFGASVNMVYDGSPNQGFIKAHKVFSIEKILFILYGKLSPAQVHQLMKDACS